LRGNCDTIVTNEEIRPVLYRQLVNEEDEMVIAWTIATVGALFGAIAGSLFEKTPLTAVACGLMAVGFAWGALTTARKS
jgi:hypothetical protein